MSIRIRFGEPPVAAETPPEILFAARAFLAARDEWDAACDARYDANSRCGVAAREAARAEAELQKLLLDHDALWHDIDGRLVRRNDAAGGGDEILVREPKGTAS
jgi:hypothetical protein